MAAHFAAASANRQANDLAGAAREYAMAISLQPDMAEAYLNNGYVLSELHRNEEAALSYQHGLTMRSNWPDNVIAAARNNLGAILSALGRNAEARYNWRAALAAKPDFEQAQSNLDNTPIEEGDDEDSDIDGGLDRLRTRSLSSSSSSSGMQQRREALSYPDLINLGNEAFNQGECCRADRTHLPPRAAFYTAHGIERARALSLPSCRRMDRGDRAIPASGASEGHPPRWLGICRPRRSAAPQREEPRGGARARRGR